MRDERRGEGGTGTDRSDGSRRARRIPQPDHLETLEKIFDIKGVLSRIRRDLINTSVPLEWFDRCPEVESRASSGNRQSSS